MSQTQMMVKRLSENLTMLKMKSYACLVRSLRDWVSARLSHINVWNILHYLIEKNKQLVDILKSSKLRSTLTRIDDAKSRLWELNHEMKTNPHFLDFTTLLLNSMQMLNEHNEFIWFSWMSIHLHCTLSRGIYPLTRYYHRIFIESNKEE